MQDQEDRAEMKAALNENAMDRATVQEALRVSTAVEKALQVKPADVEIRVKSVEVKVDKLAAQMDELLQVRPAEVLVEMKVIQAEVQKLKQLVSGD